MRHLIDPKDLSVEETGDILALATDENAWSGGSSLSEYVSK